MTYSKIPEIQKVHLEYKELKRRLNKQRSKLKSLYDKYSFINEIIDPQIGNLVIEESIKNLFNDLGYKAHQPPNKADLDVIAKKDKQVIGIEVKNDRHVGENELFQVIKYTGRYKRDKGLEMHPLIIWNNSKQGHQFDKNRIKDAEINKYGIITTEELHKGFLKVKQDKIPFELFNNMIHQIGLIKFSNSEIKKKESSVNV